MPFTGGHCYERLARLMIEFALLVKKEKHNNAIIMLTVCITIQEGRCFIPLSRKAICNNQMDITKCKSYLKIKQLMYLSCIYLQKALPLHIYREQKGRSGPYVT
jgi:hypothetical protein